MPVINLLNLRVEILEALPVAVIKSVALSKEKYANHVLVYYLSIVYSFLSGSILYVYSIYV